MTSPTSANTGKWPEVTTHLLPLSVAGSVQAHIVNLGWYEALEPEARAKLDAVMAGLEAGLWDLATSTNEIAEACSTGAACPEGGIYTAYPMTLVPVADADRARVAAIALETILPEWASRCEATYPGCAETWNSTIGAARGLAIK